MSFMLTKIAPLLGASLDNGGLSTIAAFGGQGCRRGASLSKVAAFCRQFLAAEGCPQFTNSATFVDNFGQPYYINLGKCPLKGASLPPKLCPKLPQKVSYLLHTVSAEKTLLHTEMNQCVRALNSL